jgi:hypothetical protein
VKAAVHRAQGGVLRAQFDSPALEEMRTEMRRAARRRDATTIGAAILLGGLVWLGVSNGGEWPGWALTLLGVGWLLVASRDR